MVLRSCSYGKPTLTMLTVKDGKTVGDLMADDVSLVYIFKQGLVILTGCSHAGIISIIEAAKQITGINDVNAVIGGFHLIDAEDERINKTVGELAALSSGMIYIGHCTGLRAETKLLQEFGNQFEKFYTGMTITI